MGLYFQKLLITCKMMFGIILIAGLICIRFHTTFSAKILYDIQTLDVCKDPEYAHIDNVIKKFQLSRYNRTVKMLEFQINSKVPIDENIEGTISTAKWTNGKWLSIPFIPYVADICSIAYQYYPEQMLYMLTGMGVAHPDRCPFPAFSAKILYEMQTLEICKDPEYAHIDNMVKKLKISRYNRTVKMLEFEISSDEPIDENIEGTIIAAKWTNGKWLSIPFIPYVPDICNVVYQNYPEQVSFFMTAFGVEHPDRCPFPAGNYSIHNFPMVTKYEVATLIPINGRFMFKSILREIATKKIVYCIEGTTLQTKV
ncbi:uncharacterized protein [Diabrotica undecimpunctata]|uniref:uncharacterized protein n=1 Tax=Diabrotica undecimpunctata TaxID=50387 RepID=UPI003B633981